MLKLVLLSFFSVLILDISSQNYTNYFTGDITDALTNPDYGVCLMGGATEHDEAMKWFLEKANGGDVVVLRASGSDGYNDYFYSELGVAINSVETFVIHNAAGGIDPYVLQQVGNAEAIWFAGGNQYDYVSYFKDNAMEDALNYHINIKQGVIGGTSAGMAIMGGYYFDAANGTVSSSLALSNPYHSKVSLGYNNFIDVPYLENVITDSHYDDPDRRGRHTVFLARYAKDIGIRSFGIACNEYTAVCIDEEANVNVYGDYPNYQEFAYFLQANCVDDYQPELCVSASPLHWEGANDAVKVYKVPGTPTGEHSFNINDWTTGSGGTWENWFVQNGVISYLPGENPNCDQVFIEEIDENEFVVFPNPFTEVITVPVKAVFDYTIFNLLGEEVLSERRKMSPNIVTSDLPKGMYMLEIIVDGHGQIIKIIK